MLVCSMAGMFMQTLDQTIANVTLPHMQGSLSASHDQIMWVLTSYIVASAIMTTPIGWLASRFGKKNVAIVSITGFTIASALCGAAQNLEQIIFFRILQGAFGAALSPLSQAIMIDLYPAHKRGSVMAIWGMGVLLGPIMGPTLGGWITDYANWRWVFYINVPFGIASVLGIMLFFKDSNRDETMRFDWTGFGLLAVSIGALQIMLDRGTGEGWFESNEIIIEAIVAGLAFYLFLTYFLTSKTSFLPKEIFRDKNFLISASLMFITASMLVATSSILPIYMQKLGGYSVTEAGLIMSPRGIGTMIAMIIAGRMVNYIDSRIFIAVGTCMILGTTWDMSTWTPGVSASTMVVMGTLQGAGMGLIFPVINLIAFATIPQSLRTDAASMMNLMRNIGAAIGISVTTTVLTSSIQINHAQISEAVTPFNRNLNVNSPSIFWNTQTPSGINQLNQIVDWNAQVIAYSNDFILMFFMCLPALLLVFLIKRPNLGLSKPNDVSVME